MAPAAQSASGAPGWLRGPERTTRRRPPPGRRRGQPPGIPEQRPSWVSEWERGTDLDVGRDGGNARGEESREKGGGGPTGRDEPDFQTAEARKRLCEEGGRDPPGSGSPSPNGCLLRSSHDLVPVSTRLVMFLLWRVFAPSRKTRER